MPARRGGPDARRRGG